MGRVVVLVASRDLAQSFRVAKVAKVNKVGGEVILFVQRHLGHGGLEFFQTHLENDNLFSAPAQLK